MVSRLIRIDGGEFRSTKLSGFMKETLAAIRDHGGSIKPVGGGWWEFADGEGAGPRTGLSTIRALTERGYLEHEDNQRVAFWRRSYHLTQRGKDWTP